MDTQIASSPSSIGGGFQTSQPHQDEQVDFVKMMLFKQFMESSMEKRMYKPTRALLLDPPYRAPSSSVDSFP